MSSITLHNGDIPAELSFGSCVAVDTESMGLHWARDRLCVIQLSSGDGSAHLVQFEKGKYNAPNLKKLFSDPTITKLFHFARADLAMIAFHLDVMPRPVYCTKIASLLARTYIDKHGLKEIVKDLLGIDLIKEQQTSDWGAPLLSREQQAYAASDVLYLHRLREKLNLMLCREDRMTLANATFDCLPARAMLDLAGWENVDVFAHRPITRQG